MTTGRGVCMLSADGDLDLAASSFTVCGASESPPLHDSVSSAIAALRKASRSVRRAGAGVAGFART
jgi:hypothetical protein